MKVDVTLAPGATLPKYATPGAAALDLYALDNVTMGVDTPTLIDTGVTVAIPLGFYGQIQGRSGLAFKENVSVHPGVIDSDYRGRVKVLMTKHSTQSGVIQIEDTTPFEIKKGDRIAQMLILPVAKVELEQVETLDTTERGEGGFGSTGVASA